MNSGQFASTTIWLSSLVLPSVVFALGNTFSSRTRTLMRAGVAISFGWALTAAYVIAAQAIRQSELTPSEMLTFYDHDGAPRAFAAIFGWIPSALVVAMTWGSARWFRRQ